MPATMLEGPAAQEIRSAFASVGYGQDSVTEDFSFALTQSNNIEHDALPIAAFWQKPYDQFSSALAVRTYRDGEPSHLDKHISVLAQDLWLPYLIILARDTYKCWETLPLNGVAAQQPSQEPLFVCRRGDLERNLQRHKDRVSPEHISRQKYRFRQMALYEASSNSSSFFEWAFEPTRKELRKHISKVARSVGGIQIGTSEEERARWLLRLLAARIALDKGWSAPANAGRADGEALLCAARDYPGYRQSSLSAQEIASVVAEELSLINMAAVDSALLGQIFQTSALPSELRREWKLYPTPARIAWEMMKSLPVETIPSASRRIWDGTCGTGSLLVAGLERLRTAQGPADEAGFCMRVSRMIGGNDQQSVLTEATRVALDLDIGKSLEWDLTSMDVKRVEFDNLSLNPTIVVGNPPFEAHSGRPERAIAILSHYLRQLPVGGLISIIVPKTLLSGGLTRGRQLREDLLEKLDILEIWDLPRGTFPGANSDAAVISGRRPGAISSHGRPVLWRFMSAKSRSPLLDIADAQTLWQKGADRAIYPPLLLRLRQALAIESYIPLHRFVPERNRTKGITLGKASREPGTLSHQWEAGRKPYLERRLGMLPFRLPPRNRQSWLRYSQSLERPRPQHEGLFCRQKLFISRHETRGGSWPLRAAVDYEGIFPSDQFYVLDPELPYTADVLAAIFNSAFANCWLRLANPGFTTRLRECLGIPVPSEPDRSVLEELERLSCLLGRGYEILSKSAIYRVDRLVYDLYGLSVPLRAQIAAYFRWKGEKRPGFNDVLVEDMPIEWPEPGSVYGPHHERRLKELSEHQDGARPEDIEQEFEELLQRTERAALLQSAQAQPLYDNGRPNPMALLYLAEADRA